MSRTEHTTQSKQLQNSSGLDDDLVHRLEEHADYLASSKCAWWLKYFANDVAEVLLPEAAEYDRNHASYLEARLAAMRRDISLIENGIGTVAKKLVGAYRANGCWTKSEGMDAELIENLISRLADYGLFDDEADPELDQAIYEDLSRIERRKLKAKLGK